MKNLGLRYFFLLLCCLLTTTAIAQKVTLSGYVRDAETGESLLSATVYIEEAAEGAQTNSYGFYSVSVPPGSYKVIYSYVGYAPIEQTMDLIAAQRIETKGSGSDQQPER